MVSAATLGLDVALRVGDPTQIEITAAQYLSFINMAMQDLSNGLWLRPKTEDVSTELVEDVYEYVVPDNFAYVRMLVVEDDEGDYPAQNIIPFHMWEIRSTTDGPKFIFWKDVWHNLTAGRKLKVVGQKRFPLILSSSDSIPSGADTVLRERATAYAFERLASGSDELSQRRARGAEQAWAKSEQYKARIPMQFRLLQDSVIVPDSNVSDDLEDTLHVIYVGISDSYPATRVGIQAAIDTLNAAYLLDGVTGIVQLPASSITLDDTTSLVLRAGVIVKGWGVHTTYLKAPVTASSYTMFITPGNVDAATYGTGRTVTTANANMGDFTITIADTSSFAADDYITLTTTAGLIFQICRIRTVTSGTVLTLYDPLYDTFLTTKGASIKKMTHMTINCGIKDVTLSGVNATGPTIGALLDQIAYSEFDFATEDWIGNHTAVVITDRIGSGFVPRIGYKLDIKIRDSRSGSSVYAGIALAYVAMSMIHVWSYDAFSVACRADMCHGNNFPIVSCDVVPSRSFKLSASCHNVIGSVHTDRGYFPQAGNGRSIVFADSSHHNSVAAIHATDSLEIDVWFDGGGEFGVASNTDSQFSDSFNSIGSLVTSGVAAASNGNVYVGNLCRRNAIGVATSGMNLTDYSGGLGIHIGNAARIYHGAHDMEIFTGAPTYTILAGTNGRYSCWDMTHAEGVVYQYEIPQNYASNYVRFVVVWTNRSVAAGNVNWVITSCVGADAVDLNNTGTTQTQLAVVAPTTNVKKRTIHEALQAVSPGDLVTVIVVRSATSDTLGIGNDAGLIGVEMIPA